MSAHDHCMLVLVGEQYLLIATGWENPTGSNFGAAWTFIDDDEIEHAYFVSNDEDTGLFELDTGSVDLTALTCTVRKLGVPSANTARNDGQSCRNPLLKILFPT